MSSGDLLVILGILLIVDLIVAAVRFSLAQARLPHLMDMQESKPETVMRTLALLERPHLRINLRISGIIIHFILAGAVWWLSLLVFPVITNAWIEAGILIIAALIVLIAEFLVEGFVLRNVEVWAIRLTWLGRLLDFLLRPLSWFLVNILGWSPKTTRSFGAVTEDELRTWVQEGEEQGGLEQGERKMIYSIFQFGETLAREIMVPRIDIFGMDVETSLSDAIEIVARSGHSRIPVYQDTIDNLLGLLYAKDLLLIQTKDSPQSLRDFIRPAYFVPEAKKVDELLAEMQDQRFHMAIVVDEYGGVAGLVTLEDIMEEIVGEIRDEYDQAEELPYQQISPDEFLFLGRIDVEDFNEVLGTHLTREVADTLGGFMYGEIGRVPSGGEKVTVEGWNLTVEQVSGRRIRKVRANRLPVETPVEENEDDVEQRNEADAD